MSLNIVLSVLLILCTFCFAILIFYSWKKRESKIAVIYGLGVVAASIYTLGYAFQLLSININQNMFWIHIQYLGIPFAPLLWIVMCLQFVGKDHLLTKRNLAILAIVPLFIMFSNFTNNLHYLFYTSVEADYSRGFLLVVLERGPIFYFHIAFVYSVYLVGLYLILRMYLKATKEMKKQAVLMIIGSLVVFVFPLIHSLDVIDTPYDISPFGLILSGLFYLWGIFQFNMLNLSPIVMNKVFESIYDAVFILDNDNYLNSYNKAATILFEPSSTKKVVGHEATKIFSHLPQLIEIIEQNEPNAVPVLIQLGQRYYNVQYSLINGRNNKQVGKMLILHDITETIQYEKSLLQQSKQLEELNLFKDKMFSIVAHDIRDPLAVLVNLMEIMEEELQAVALFELKGSHHEIVEEMRKQINNTFYLVEGLLEWFHTQSAGQLFNPVERELGKIVANTINLMQVKIDSKNIHVKSTISDDVAVYADKDMLELILRNLLSNAVKFTRNGGHINVAAEVKEDKVIVSISDTGQGITVDEGSYLLQDEFPMSKRGTAGEQGIGLGLSICREFVRLNGGEIWFDSSVNVGTTFYFSLPIVQQMLNDTRAKEGIV